jgi:glycosyltransferase involved in cell wall biosynthesis
MVRIAFIGVRGVPARYSGFETCVENVGSRLAARGHEVTVFCRSQHYPGRRPAHHGMALRYLPAIPGKHLETITHTALSAAGCGGQDALVCMGVGNAPVVRLLEAAGRRTVFNVDGADWQRAKWGPAAARYLRVSEVLAAHSSSVLIADAHAVGRYYMERFGRVSEYVPYGAVPPADRGTDTPLALGVEPGGYALFVGRLEPENGAHDFLRGAAAAGVPPVVVGGATYPGQYVDALYRDAPPGAVFAGFRFGAEYQQLTAHARVFVLAAEVGGTHPVLLEQMAAGNCILARDTASNREVLAETGLFWSTPGELGDLLQRAWNNPGLRSSLGRAALRRRQENYDWDAVTTRYEELCELTRRR